MSIYRPRPIDLSLISTYPLASRLSKVTHTDFAQPLTDQQAGQMSALLDSLPKILATENLRAIAAAIIQARAKNKAIIWGIGGHFIKTGLAPILIDLMKRGFVSSIAMNGSGVIHDFEIALTGSTSEDVDDALGAGAFGMADQLGLGESVGRTLVAMQPPHGSYSLQHEAYRLKIPVTVHVTLGADIIHLHPQADGAAIGATSHQDFRLMTAIVGELSGGGAYLNIGSAVTLPEVFLKAVTVVRNLGNPLQDFTTANFDFIQHYRPNTNVVRRPVANGAGRGYSITGHHELMIPLLAAAIVSGSTE
jgi:hypothetical protein